MKFPELDIREDVKFTVTSKAAEEDQIFPDTANKLTFHNGLKWTLDGAKLQNKGRVSVVLVVDCAKILNLEKNRRYR